ncbi:NAD(P)H-dependent glycerol-3-phosphate dehydrogenase [Metamycoplasma phocicerebrale]|uniref:Glycerol-3-phosphate dehydrogenase n=1 Tax=Metamycoplasma phocicerebrale TaxID=142649 RepID=A0A3Q9V328_9BACT|nr:NAD(P)H-dependent glycerol-3-phosphate dehydrogenase [Metamycoplasma phocicerebrale]AZZ65483.1 NAD(P)H-dependent glycerol-3-phosphate dehydrogenase [Metamycoplasma phocicerebrale]
MENKIAILGSGAMGTACASILKENKQNVIIYGINDQELDDLKKGYNSKYFQNKKLYEFEVTKNLEEAIKEANYILIAIPTKFIPDVFFDLVKKINNKTIIINVSKGFWPNSTDFIHTKMDKIIKENPNIEGIVSLIGPSFAIDIINKNITLINSVSKDIQLAKKVKKLFSNEWFGVIINNDVIGAEVGSTFKNVIAIASGMAEGLGYSTNTQAALLTIGLKEMQKYSLSLGARPETIYELSGLGDLILTGLSDKSRNYCFGKSFFNKKIDENAITIEGLKALEYIYAQNKDNNKIKLPLINGLYKIVYNKENPKEIIKGLMKNLITD